MIADRKETTKDEHSKTPPKKSAFLERKGSTTSSSNTNQESDAMFERYLTQPIPVIVNRSKLKELAEEIEAACLKSVPTLVVPDKP